MELTVIIVNYQVKYFLEQCLNSVLQATKGIHSEVMVVDNHSNDGSMEYLRPLFPGICFLENDQNRGFACANNQALQKARGEYVMFLNPDTLVPEDCFQLCLKQLKNEPLAGALGVRMIDGKGCFLPESKRAFPSPLAAFYKLTGLATLFPFSGIFNQYALGNLDEHRNHQVPVLSGACMLVKKSILDNLNGFDERFFMYGEDIDLSYRIQKAGFQNHYFAGTSLIHFKGESSRKSGLNYIRVFYAAMLIFVQKHYSSESAKLFSYFIKTAITIRAWIAVFGRVFRPYWLPVTDAIFIWLAFTTVSWIWVALIRNGQGFGFPYLVIALPFFALIFISAASLMGLYDKNKKTSKTLISVAFAAVVTLAAYALLPESLRFSRGVMLWGSLSGAILLLLFRQILPIKKEKGFHAGNTGQTLVVATEKEYREIELLLKKSLLENTLLGRVSVTKTESTAICSLQNLESVINSLPVSGIIFCTGTISLTGIIQYMQRLKNKKLQFLFHLSGTRSIVGSEGVAEGGIIPADIVYGIADPYQKRMKRIMDLLFSIFLLISFPAHLLLHPKAGMLLLNACRVLTGKKTWIGYASPAENLPPLKKCVRSHLEPNVVFNDQLLSKADKMYAKNYDWWKELVWMGKNYPYLGKG